MIDIALQQLQYAIVLNLIDFSLTRDVRKMRRNSNTVKHKRKRFLVVEGMVNHETFYLTLLETLLTGNI